MSINDDLPMYIMVFIMIIMLVLIVFVGIYNYNQDKEIKEYCIKNTVKSCYLHCIHIRGGVNQQYCIKKASDLSKLMEIMK